MNSAFYIYASVGVFTAIVTVVWLILLLTSLFFRPRPDARPRVIERMLIVTSALMILCFGVVFLLLRTRGAA